VTVASAAPALLLAALSQTSSPVQPAGCLGGAVTEQAGHVTRVLAPAPDRDVLVECLRYEYSPEGDLVAAFDALGAPMRLAYDRHLMVKETRRGGLSFHFSYEDRGNDARCIATWGDDGIYRRTLIYDWQNHTTIVTDSRDASTIYQMNADDAVMSVTEAMGDPSGRLIARMDPPMRLSRFEWKSEVDLLAQPGRIGASPVKRMVAFTDPAGERTLLDYDKQGMLVGLRLPNGAQTRWQYDRLGRCTEAVDAKGNRERREFDLAGRVRRVDVPDGNVRRLDYDPDGNVLSGRDQHYDVQFTYRGMGRLASRTQEGTTVKFEYDKEDALVAIHNEAGAMYRFTLDKVGNVKEESGFDGVLRKFGRVRPSSNESSISWKTRGTRKRVVAWPHDDGR